MSSTKRFTLYGPWLVMAAVWPAVSGGGVCPEMAVGVHEIPAGNSTTFVAVGQAISLSQDAGSYTLAEAEARQEARRILKDRLSPDLKTIRLSGLVDVSVCRANGIVFATLRLDEANARRAASLQNLIERSITNTPTPKP